MKQPIEGMKHRPYGEEHMFPAWYGYVLFAVNDAVICEEFKDKTGIIVKYFLQGGQIGKMIDSATGYEKDVLVKWCDFITEHHFGVEDA